MIKPAEISVRYSDLDVMGHVNNSVYLTYFEMARVHYFGNFLGRDWDWKKDGIILVKNEIEYLKPVFLHDRPKIEVFTSHIGTKSFVLDYRVTVGDKLCATGSSTLVAFDSEKNTTVVISEGMKAMLVSLKKEQ
ncbi:MAG: acyl-CoA thioesterase [Crocinitomicaceae bacterium]|nr:acyl-CoA thioesterase [Crocinitomicaceae bacterium]MDG1658104.1 acyl-CoA thioesterase [Crocinitomicaceae bacterium]MDG2440188.1 acyl-CoA thioesterase [Crocinitomicaceae bacterium]